MLSRPPIHPIRHPFSCLLNLCALQTQPFWQLSFAFSLLLFVFSGQIAYTYWYFPQYTTRVYGAHSSTLKVEAVRPSETSANLYQTARRPIPKNSSIDLWRNLK
jgi:hypothetical protein